MSLDGFIVLTKGGIPLYSKTAEMDLTVNTVLLGGFLTAIQTFAHELDDSKDTYIRELKMQNFNLMYRQVDIGTFLGIANPNVKFKSAEMLLEYLILIFLSRFRTILIEDDTPDINQFNVFDDTFLKLRSWKEKNIKKWFEKEFTSSNLLQGILNNLINYFPINELVKLSPDNLIILGKRLIWVSFNISLEEEKRITNELEAKTSQIYGADIFTSIKKKVQSDLENIRIFGKGT